MDLAIRPYHNTSLNIPSLQAEGMYYVEIPILKPYVQKTPNILDSKGVRRRLHERQVYSFLDSNPEDFVGVSEIMRKMNLTRADTLAALEGLGNKVRRPFFARPDEGDLYRVSERGMTPREKFRLIFDTLSRG